MLKLLIIPLLLGIIAWYIYRQIAGYMRVEPHLPSSPGFYSITLNEKQLKQTSAATWITVLTGIGLFLVALLLGVKVKILFLLFPIAIYLIGQAWVFSNHLKESRKLNIWFHPQKSLLRIQHPQIGLYEFNIIVDIHRVHNVSAVQRNRNQLFGYYEIQTRDISFRIPFLFRNNTDNTFFFSELDQLVRHQEKKVLFPII